MPRDGRAARSYRARLALAEALLDLLNEGIEKPTAVEIAKRAGVSLRLVFHHFDDLEAIYASAADRQLERVRAQIKRIDSALPFAKRLAVFARQRAKLFEYVTPVRRASIRIEPSSPEISRRLREAHEMARQHTCETFGRELASVPGDETSEVTTALDAATSWEMWDFLRRRSALSVTQASRVIERVIRGLFASQKIRETIKDGP